MFFFFFLDSKFHTCAFHKLNEKSEVLFFNCVISSEESGRTNAVARANPVAATVHPIGLLIRVTQKHFYVSN